MVNIAFGKSAHIFRFFEVMRLELAYYIAPCDLLNLARTCKKIRSDLWKDRVIWKRALAQSGLAPEYPICHPRSLVILYFTQDCMMCGTKTENNAIQSLALRLCANCEKIEFIPTPDQPPEFSTTIWNKGPHRYVMKAFRRDPSRSIIRLEPITTLVNSVPYFPPVVNMSTPCVYGSSQLEQSWLGLLEAQQVKRPPQAMAHQQTRTAGRRYKGRATRNGSNGGTTPPPAAFDFREESPGPGPVRSRRSAPTKQRQIGGYTSRSAPYP